MNLQGHNIRIEHLTIHSFTDINCFATGPSNITSALRSVCNSNLVLA